MTTHFILFFKIKVSVKEQAVDLEVELEAVVKSTVIY